MRRQAAFLLIGLGIVECTFICAAPSPSPSLLSTPKIPVLSSLMKPSLWKRITQEREIMVNAKLEKGTEENLMKYSFYAAMLANAPLPKVRKILTDYSLYTRIIPYVDRADYAPLDHVLQLEGGIWNFKLRSAIHFEEPSERWIHYQVVGGHFTGLTGDIYFEAWGEKGTAIYFNGVKQGEEWPPRFVIERGAEIVFRYTAGRMRSYIEDLKKEELNKIEKGARYGEQGQQVPQPKSHL